MTSAMPLMPMPPMPTKCTGLMSRGSFMPSPKQIMTTASGGREAPRLLFYQRFHHTLAV
jgi:hypothetical protein